MFLKISQNSQENACATVFFLIKLQTTLAEAVSQRCSVEKVFLEISQNSQENICARVSFLIKLQAEACNFIKKEALAQVFCEIFKNTIFYRTPLMAASVLKMDDDLFEKKSHLEHGQTSGMEIFAKIVYKFQPLTIFNKSFILDV